MLAPWRQIVAQLLAHDRGHSAPASASSWGARCRDHIPDYEVRMLVLLLGALDPVQMLGMLNEVRSHLCKLSYKTRM